ncbi:MAG: hypothetical protein GQ525_15615 [Draconibacterium sp.]|nr:hypothetical protein [Draconibacterium sp.]
MNEISKMDEVRLGEIYFNDTIYYFQSWQLCNGCHPDEAQSKLQSVAQLLTEQKSKLRESF